MTRPPLCFVLMPFGKKATAHGREVDFDAVYTRLIRPGIEAAGLEPLRADEERTGGIIHKPMFERLVLAEFAVADLTAANANVFYELGVRHAARPAATLLLFARDQGQLPFDVQSLRALPYTLGDDGAPDDPATTIEAIRARLTEAREMPVDSPLYQLLEDYPSIKHEKTDVFRDRVDIERTLAERLAAARASGVDAVRALEQELGSGPGGIGDAPAGVVVDLFLSYRACKAWKEMAALVGRMAPPLARSVMIQEQLALALNRDGQGERAEQVLTGLLKRTGPSSETYGILGRVYKDRWEKALAAGAHLEAPGALERAIDAYLKGFEADWRDAYPGVNAVTLMELAEPKDPRQADLLPVVAYAVSRRIAGGQPDYWDHATQLELAVLARDQRAAVSAVGRALARVREKWEPETTARNLRLIREARERRGESLPWARSIEDALASRGQA